MLNDGKAWLVCLFLLPVFTLAQTSFTQFYQEGATSEPFAVETLGDSLIIVGLNDFTNGFNGCEEAVIMVYRLNGETLNSFPQDKEGLFFPEIVFQDMEIFQGEIYLGGFNRDLSDIDIGREFSLSKVSLGEGLVELGRSPIYEQSSFTSTRVRDMAISPLGRVAMVSQDGLILADTSGIFDQEIVGGFDSTLFRVEFFSEGSLFIADSFSVSLVDIGGEEAVGINFPDRVVDMKKEGDSVFVATNTTFYVFNTLLNLEDSLDLSSRFEEVYQLTTYEDIIHILGKSSEGIGIYTLERKDINQPGSGQFSPNVFPFRPIIAPLESGWAGAMVSEAEEIPANTLSFYLPFTGVLEPTTSYNISLVNFQIDATYADTAIFIPQFDPRPFWSSVEFDYTLTVLNEGNSPITSFGSLISDLGGTFCVLGNEFLKSNVVVERDGTREIKGRARYSVGIVYQGDSIEICATVLAPDAAWESDLSQNSLCTFLTTDRLPVSIEKELQSQFIIYPNPVENTLNLSFEGSLSDEINVKLFSLEGAKLLENTFRSPYMTLPMERFNPGIYLLEVQMGARRFWQKIVKG